MANLNIRDIDEEVLAELRVIAAKARMSREAYARRILTLVARSEELQLLLAEWSSRQKEAK